MSKRSIIRVRFGNVEHGWLSVEVEVESTKFTFFASYTPYDFVTDLVETLSRVLTAEGTYVARVNEEPTESDWTFERVEDFVVFSIVQYPGNARRRGEGKQLVEARGPVLEIVLPFWRGLRELSGRYMEDDYYTAHWGRNFPSKALDRLTQRIKQAMREVE